MLSVFHLMLPSKVNSPLIIIFAKAISSILISAMRTCNISVFIISIFPRKGYLPCADYLVHPPEFEGQKRIIMLFYPHLIIIREQHDGQNLSLATRAHQTLDKTGYFSLNHRITFRFDPQPNRSSCIKCVVAPTIDRSESTDQATPANQPRSYSPGNSFSLYGVLETSLTYCSTGYFVTLAS